MQHLVQIRALSRFTPMIYKHFEVKVDSVVLENVLAMATSTYFIQNKKASESFEILLHP